MLARAFLVNRSSLSDPKLAIEGFDPLPGHVAFHRSILMIHDVFMPLDGFSITYDSSHPNFKCSSLHKIES